MNVRIRAFAQLRESIGADRRIDIPDGTSVGRLLTLLGDESAQTHAALFTEGGELRGHIILMKNGKRISRREIDTLVLVDGDEIALFPPVAGG